jgi:hypothetical protein
VSPRLHCSLRVEWLEDRLTPTAPGLVGGVGSLRAASLLVESPGTAKVSVTTFRTDVPIDTSFGMQLRIDIPVFSLVQMETQASFTNIGNVFFPSFDSALAALEDVADVGVIATPQSVQPAPTPSPTPTPVSGQGLASVLLAHVPAVSSLQGAIASSTNATLALSANAAVTPGITLTTTPVRTPSTPASGGDDTTVDAFQPIVPDVDVLPPGDRIPIAPRSLPDGAAGATPMPPARGGDTVPDAPADKAPGVAPAEKETAALPAEEVAMGFALERVDEAAESLSLSAPVDVAHAITDWRVLLLGVLAASSAGAAWVAWRREWTKERELDLLETEGLLPRPLLN